nr:MAG TPA: hypothetical protein [Caudoviricetes sp.]
MIFALETSQSSRLFSISDQKKVRSSRITFEKDLLRQSFGVVVGIRFIHTSSQPAVVRSKSSGLTSTNSQSRSHFFSRTQL